MKDIPAFFEEYHVDPKDEEKFKNRVNYVEIYQKQEGIAGSMVQLVDSPGTQASASDTKVAKDFAEKADAIVYMINATYAFDEEERKYIKEHFANRQKKNVFFVVNKFNLLDEDGEKKKLKNRAREELQDVFADENGIFNQKLYDERVFYVDARGSLNARVGEATKAERNTEGGKISDDTTGVPDFEAKLGEFLTSGDRDKTALSAYRVQMADFYMLAENSCHSQLSILRKGKDTVAKELAGFKEAKEKAEREIQDISDDIETTQKDIIRDARDVYDIYLDSIEAEWKDYFSEKSASMGVDTVDLLLAKAQSLISIWKSKEDRETVLDEKTKAATKDFVDGIEAFMKEKADFMKEQYQIRLEERMRELQSKLERHQANLEKLEIPMDISEIIKAIAEVYSIPGINENNANLGQALIAILCSDPELVVTAGSGKAGTVDFVIDVIKTNVIDIILMSAFMAVFPTHALLTVAAFAIIKLTKTEMRSADMTEKMIAQTMDAIINGSTDPDGNPVAGLKKEGKANFTANTERIIGGAMKRTGQKLTQGIRDRLDAIEIQLESANQILTESKNAIEDETVRMNKVLKTFSQAVSEMSELTNSQPLTVADIKKLATQRAD